MNAYGLDVAVAIADLNDRADAILALVARVTRTRDPNLADQVADQAENLRSAARRFRLAIPPEESEISLRRTPCSLT